MAEPENPEIELEYAFSIRVNHGDKVALEGPMRSRTFEPSSGGEVWGPHLQGIVVPQSGADFGSNGLLELNLMLQATDGAWIYMNQLGYEHSETEDGEPYFRVTPYFDTPKGTHEWLSRTVFIGTAERQNDPSHTTFHYYELL